MKNNGYDRVIINTNSWKVTLPLKKKDVVLEWDVDDDGDDYEERLGL
jgi:hypothetical protein